jgi:hypothetical protein
MDNEEFQLMINQSIIKDNRTHKIRVDLIDGIIWYIIGFIKGGV